MDPITAGMQLVSTIVDKIFPDKDKADAAKLEILKLQQSGELQKEQNDFHLTIEQIKVNAVEAASGSLFIGGARPGAMWVCVVGLGYTFLLQPILEWVSLILKVPTPPVIDTGMLVQLLIATLGLAGWRSLDKSNGVASK